MTEFVLDERLENDTVFIGNGMLTQYRLHRNAAFPWLVLIPRKPDLVELTDLDEADQKLLWADITWSMAVMQNLYNPTKLNVANLGNIVSQLHIHVIARYDHDKAWPGPVWNSGVNAQYADDDLNKAITSLKHALNLDPAV